MALLGNRGGDTHVGYIASGDGEVSGSWQRTQSWVSGWAPDSDRVIFAGRCGAIWNIYSVSLATREVKQLANLDKINTYPAWTPLGDKIAYEYAESNGNLWMIELN